MVSQSGYGQVGFMPWNLEPLLTPFISFFYFYSIFEFFQLQCNVEIPPRLYLFLSRSLHNSKSGTTTTEFVVTVYKSNFRNKIKSL